MANHNHLVGLGTPKDVCSAGNKGQNQNSAILALKNMLKLPADIHIRDLFPIEMPAEFLRLMKCK